MQQKTNVWVKGSNLSVVTSSNIWQCSLNFMSPVRVYINQNLELYKCVHWNWGNCGVTNLLKNCCLFRLIIYTDPVTPSSVLKIKVADNCFVYSFLTLQNCWNWACWLQVDHSMRGNMEIVDIDLEPVFNLWLKGGIVVMATSPVKWLVWFLASTREKMVKSVAKYDHSCVPITINISLPAYMN